MQLQRVQSRTVHVWRGNAPTISVGVPNWFTQGQAASLSAVSEVAMPSAAQVAVWIEYPLGTPTMPGTLTRLPWSGGAYGTVAAGATGYTDAGPAPPQGAMFGVWIDYYNPGGILGSYYNGNGTPYTLGYSPYDVANFTAASGLPAGFGSTPTALPTSFLQGLVLFPVALRGMSSVPAFGQLGDSRTVGIRPSSFGQFDNGSTGLAVGSLYPYINLGTAGETTQAALASYARRLALLGLCQAAVYGYGINDFFVANRTVAQLQADEASFFAMIAPLGLVWAILTLSCIASSTDNFASVANQTTNSTNANRLAENAFRRAGAGFPAGLLDVWDIAAAVEYNWQIGAGLWIPGATIGDGVHESLAGHLLQRAACRPTQLVAGL